MSLFTRFLKPPPVHLHALEPNETWFERCVWLVLLVKELKAEREQLSARNAELLNQMNAGRPITVAQEELLAMRRELNEMHKAKAKLQNRMARAMQVNQSLTDELNDLRNGFVRAA